MASNFMYDGEESNRIGCFGWLLIPYAFLVFKYGKAYDGNAVDLFPNLLYYSGCLFALIVILYLLFMLLKVLWIVVGAPVVITYWAFKYTREFINLLLFRHKKGDLIFIQKLLLASVNFMTVFYVLTFVWVWWLNIICIMLFFVNAKVVFNYFKEEPLPENIAIKDDGEMHIALTIAVIGISLFAFVLISMLADSKLFIYNLKEWKHLLVDPL